jgi:hypothetical protein
MIFKQLGDENLNILLYPHFIRMEKIIAMNEFERVKTRIVSKSLAPFLNVSYELFNIKFSNRV